MKKIMCFLAVLMFVCAGCSAEQAAEPDGTDINKETEEIFPENSEEETEKEEVQEMILKINDEMIDTVWEDNESVEELKALVSKGDLSISMHMYGGWEQVGNIGSRLIRNDVQTVAQPGDIMLYSGDQIVLFYGNNSWAYTKLGTMQKSQSKLEDLLGNGDISLTLSME